MKIKVIQSGSKGNCYKITDNKGKILILELGIKPQKIIHEIDNIDNVSGMIYSHNHSDHNFKGNSNYFQKLGFNVLQYENIVDKKKYMFDNFLVIPLACKHGDVTSYSFVIANGTKTIYFATDTTEPKLLNSLNIDLFLLECNHSFEQNEIEIEKALYDEDDEVNQHKIYILEQAEKRHLSVEKAFAYLKKVAFKEKSNIVFIHETSRMIPNEIKTKLFKDIKQLKFKSVEFANNGKIYEI